MKKFLTTIALLGMLLFGFGLSANQQVDAAAYGGHLYTVPRAMRGHWHFTSHHNVGTYGVPRRFKRVYKRITLTRHGITFTRRGRVGLRGHYILMKAPNRHWTTRQMGRAERYAKRHRWLGVSVNSHHSFNFTQFWLHWYESSNTGDLSLHGRRLCFANVFTKDYYRR